jgi:hypothetical protein
MGNHSQRWLVTCIHHGKAFKRVVIGGMKHGHTHKIYSLRYVSMGMLQRPSRAYFGQ